MRIFLLLTAICFSFTLQGQTSLERQVIGSMGGFSNAGNTRVAFTVGEPIVTTEYGPSIALTQGFHQAVSGLVAPIEINVFNAFSPDGDQVNDFWVIPDLAFYPENKVVVFNRWGNELRVFDNYDNNTVVWDGTNQDGSPISKGTYFYLITYEDDGNTGSQTGWVYLSR